MVNVTHIDTSSDEKDFKIKSMINNLQQAYNAEKQWLALLPILRLAIGCEDLLAMLNKFEKEGKAHVQRLEIIFSILGASKVEQSNKDIEVLVEECYDIIDVTPRNSFIRDAGLIVGLQQLQQYQITTYTSLLAQALLYDKQKIVNLLRVIIYNKHQEEEQLAMAGASQMLDKIVGN
ncbi:DUF892 family protein [Pedobacter sp. SL55]|uniref:DUF892 family protein n=1 Tax=Pedobacter sp. SL55 TaxID=2995161 RepID=UPI00226FAC2F|nr:DUF892 family protein [Pedobacter sp. SL55]WAC40169.1 DUF892 family protein [Pedobacter sp. SL55]